MQKFKKFIEYLDDLLKNHPLPGLKAQSIMAPEFRIPQEFITNNHISAKKSSVLILLYQDESEIKTVLIKRSEYEGVHSGQISFPGGQYEEIDYSLNQTAIREANEEIGVEISKIFIIGHLSKLYIPPSNFEVLPVVAFYQGKPEFRLASTEVVKIIEVKISNLLDKITKQTTKMNVRGFTFNTPYFNIHNNIVWGATAMIISEFIEILRSNAIKLNQG